MKKQSLIKAGIITLTATGIAINTSSHHVHADTIDNQDQSHLVQLKTSRHNIKSQLLAAKENHEDASKISALQSQIASLDSRIGDIDKTPKNDNKDKTQDQTNQKNDQQNNQSNQNEENKQVNQAVASRAAFNAVNTQKQVTNIQSAVPSVSNTNVSNARQTVIATAKSLLGIPYVWGGSNPATGLDCSGLTSYIYRQVGIDIGRTTYNQDATGRHVSMSELKPGDLILEEGGAHVAVYIGNGMQIAAPQPGEVVKMQPIWGAMYGLRYLD